MKMKELRKHFRFDDTHYLQSSTTSEMNDMVIHITQRHIEENGYVKEIMQNQKMDIEFPFID